MSGSERALSRIRDRVDRGEVAAEDLAQALQKAEDVADRDALWSRWAEQGLFDRPIAQTGWTSFKGNRVREIVDDGQRSE